MFFLSISRNIVINKHPLPVPRSKILRFLFFIFFNFFIESTNNSDSGLGSNV